MNVRRYTKSEVAQRKTANETLFDPNASVQKKYHARLLLKQTEEDARSRAAKNAQRLDEPVPRVSEHRVQPPPASPEEEAAKKRFFDALEKMLEAAGEADPASDPQKETGDPEMSAAGVAPCDSVSEPLPEPDKICEFCLISTTKCQHGATRAVSTRVQ